MKEKNRVIGQCKDPEGTPVKDMQKRASIIRAIIIAASCICICIGVVLFLIQRF